MDFFGDLHWYSYDIICGSRRLEVEDYILWLFYRYNSMWKKMKKKIQNNKKKAGNEIIDWENIIPERLDPGGLVFIFMLCPVQD